MSGYTNSKRDFDNEDNSSGRKRKRKSRWGGNEESKVFIPGMPTILPNNLTKEQEQIYLLQVEIEAISRQLLSGDLGIPVNPEERSPSPEPIYNNEGKRLNTREFRTRKKLEDKRHDSIQRMLSLNPLYKPPADYKPPQLKISEKVLIPQEEYPDINFVGLLIGPRGNTLKAMEKDTGAKIIIRGKGSVKEGKIGRKDGQPMPGEDEPLHAFITGLTHDSVMKAVHKIKEVIRQGVEVPEAQNDLRRMQLRELALLNGTLRESDGPRCSNCGSTAHRSWQCPDKPNVTNNVLCTNCNGVGHIARDCKEKKTTTGTTNSSKIDEEYMSLMAELGEGPVPPKNSVSNMSSYSGGMGPTIGMSSQMAPKAIAEPPPPPPFTISSSVSTTSQSATPLLPTPNMSQTNSWPTVSVQNQWPTTQSPYSVSAYPMTDSFSSNALYSSSVPMGWSQSWNSMTPSSVSPVPPPPPPTQTNGSHWNVYGMSSTHQPPPPPPPPPHQSMSNMMIPPPPPPPPPPPV